MRQIKGDELVLRQIMGLRRFREAIGCTMGTGGGNVMMNFSNQHFAVSKDGITVANSFYITRDSIAHAISSFMRQASHDANKICGDGSSTSSILTTALYEYGLILTGRYPKDKDITKLLPPSMVESKDYKVFNWEPYLSDDFQLMDSESMNIIPIKPRDLKDHLDRYEKELVELLYQLRDSINLTPEQIVHSVATISSNGDTQMADLFLEAFKAVDMEGVVITEASIAGESRVKRVDGFNFEGKVLHPGFLNPDTMSVTFENPLIFLTDKYIDYQDDMARILQLARDNDKPFVLVCGNMGDTLISSTINVMNDHKIAGAIVQAPSFGEDRVDWLHDIAAATGADFMKEDSQQQLRNYTLSNAGTVPKVVINNSGTNLVDHITIDKNKERVKSRVKALEARLDSPELTEQQKEKLVKRISNLQGRFATVFIRTKSETEQQEAAYRLEDALNAIRTALSEGVVPGGGISLMVCSKELLNRSIDICSKEYNHKEVEYNAVCMLMTDVLTEPFRILVENIGEDPKEIEKYIWNAGLSMTNPIGIELRSLRICNLVENNILDPVMVTKTAVETAFSVAKTLLQTKMMLTGDE